MGDADGYGDRNLTSQACGATGDYVTNCSDCDDTRPDITGCNTPPGSDFVTITDPDSGVSVTFPGVTEGGNTSINEVQCTDVPPGIILPQVNPVCVQVQTTATPSGLIEVCIPYDDTDCASQKPGNPTGQELCERQLSIIRCDSSGQCDPLPTSRQDVGNNKICALTDHFSTLIVATPADSDGDGVIDLADNCPHVWNLFQEDDDDDGVCDACDNCPYVYNPDHEGSNGNGVGDACDSATGEPGDCDGKGSVSIAEVQATINMYLGLKSVEACVDTDASTSVSIAEVQKVINGYLGL